MNRTAEQPKVNPPTTPSDDVAITERWLRFFIIKSIQLLVQGRSGNILNTNCMSDVGARLNMMIYLEDDPEIGATIKQTLESSFSVCPGDSFTLDILVNRVVVEVWQMKIEAPQTVHPGDTDIRKTRFFEKLGTLLKSLLVISRLLPAYHYSRNQSNYQMCYMIRRGSADVSRLGADHRVQKVGSVQSGARGQVTVNVFYRTKVSVTSQDTDYTPAQLYNQHIPAQYSQHLNFEEEHYAVDPKKRQREEDNICDEISKLSVTCGNKDVSQAPSTNSVRQSSVLLRPVRPAFVQDKGGSDEDSFLPHTPPGHTFLSGSPLPEEVEDEEEEETTNQSYRQTDIKSSTSIVRSDQPLRFAFCTDGSSAELSRLFLELKDRVDLDLFRPAPGCTASTGCPGEETESLTDDLERHEGVLRAFDDFMVEFESDGAYVYGSSGGRDELIDMMM